MRRESKPIGIQIKRIYEEPKEKGRLMETLLEEAKKFGLVPIVAWVKMPEKTIIFENPENGRTSGMLREVISLGED